MHVVQPTECYGEGRLIMYIAEPDPSVNKNGSVHERAGIDTGCGPASRTVLPLKLSRANGLVQRIIPEGS